MDSVWTFVLYRFIGASLVYVTLTGKTSALKTACSAAQPQEKGL